jgi:hypothetical protein
MKSRLPGAPAISAAFSGFVVGILATLVVTGVFGTGSSRSTGNITATLPPATPVADTQMYAAVNRIVTRELGQTYAGGKVARLKSLQIDVAGSLNNQPLPANRLSAKKSVYIEFRLYDNPLGRSWRLRTAKSDVFNVMKSLYLSQLPIYNIEMVGFYHLKGGNPASEDSALVAYMDHSVAQHIPWKHWGRDQEARVWTLLAYHYVDPRFA